jgi:nucleoside 2-deoxyribosyltransferase
MFDFYIAAPVVGLSCSKRGQIDDAILVLEKYVQDKLGRQANIYNPRKLKIPNAWNMPQSEWARCVFTEDVLAIDQSDTVVVFDFGRNGTCGTAWEAGYAFAKEKPILLVVMPGVQEQSLMVRNGCTSCISYDELLAGNIMFQDYAEQSQKEKIILN